MNMFARFDENPAMTLQDIKETKRYGRTDAPTDGHRENSIPTTNKVCGGGITINSATTVARELNRTSHILLATHNAKGEMREI